MTTLLEILEANSYDLTTRDDATWLLGRRNEIEALLEQAEDMIEKLDEEDENA